MKRDLTSDKVIQALEHEEKAIKLLEDKYAEKGYEFIHTPKDTMAYVDGLIVRDNELTAVFETKCRYKLSVETLCNQFEWRWMLTKDKVERCGKVADYLCVPLFGILYLIEDETVMIEKLWHNKKLVCDYKEKTIATPINCDIGGTVNSCNLFINMENSTKISNGSKTTKPRYVAV